ncbi:MAG: hypothetical protein QMB80_12475 [Acinetobacter towneri]
MNKYTNFESKEIVIDENEPYANIIKELIDESRLRISYLVNLTELKEIELLRYFCWIGGYGLADSIANNDSNSTTQKILDLIHKDALGAFNELNKVSKITFTWNQATNLAAGILSIENFIREIAVDRESKTLDKAEQQEIFKQIIVLISRANFLIGNAINDISESQNKKQIKKMASTGGKAKAQNYSSKMNPIFDEVFDLFLKGHPKTGKKWRFKSECAKYFIKEFYLKNPETNIDLDPKKLVNEISNRLNNLSASKKVTLLDNG